jgi:hypothetical protein
MARNAYTRILSVLGACGPSTATQISEILNMKSVQARISEFNRLFTDIEISKTGHRPAKYYLRFPKNLDIRAKDVYPNMHNDDFRLATKKFTKTRKG